MQVVLLMYMCLQLSCEKSLVVLSFSQELMIRKSSLFLLQNTNYLLNAARQLYILHGILFLYHSNKTAEVLLSNFLMFYFLFLFIVYMPFQILKCSKNLEMCGLISKKSSFLSEKENYLIYLLLQYFGSWYLLVCSLLQYVVKNII